MFWLGSCYLLWGKPTNHFLRSNLSKHLPSSRTLLRKSQCTWSYRTSNPGACCSPISLLLQLKSIQHSSQGCSPDNKYSTKLKKISITKHIACIRSHFFLLRKMTSTYEHIFFVVTLQLSNFFRLKTPVKILRGWERKALGQME